MKNRMRAICAALAVFAVAIPPFARAQAPAASPAATPPASSPATMPGKSGKRGECQTKGAGMRGPERMDTVQLCIEEGRLDCLKQAIAQKIQGAERRTFVQTCVGN